MKEKYEKIEIDIEIMSAQDVITTSSATDDTDTDTGEHDNAHVDYSSFFVDDELLSI